MGDPPAPANDHSSAPDPAERRVRADAQRNLDALLEAAKVVFATSGVDAPVREIAARAGVGVGTVYRHFPGRAELIAAVFHREIDAVADSARTLAAEHDPFEALSLWIDRYGAFLATKRGLGKALHSGNPAFEGLPAHRDQRLVPALRSLLDAAVAAGEIRGNVDPADLLTAIAGLGMFAHGDGDGPRRMTALLLDGLRYHPVPHG